MIPNLLTEHNVPWPGGGKVVDNPVVGPGRRGTGVSTAGYGAQGVVDSALIVLRASTGYQQVFPWLPWIVRRSGRDGCADRFA